MVEGVWLYYQLPFKGIHRGYSNLPGKKINVSPPGHVPVYAPAPLLLIRIRVGIFSSNITAVSLQRLFP